jgi:hypothetical protein
VGEVERRASSRRPGERWITQERLSFCDLSLDQVEGFSGSFFYFMSLRVYDQRPRLDNIDGLLIPLAD